MKRYSKPASGIDTRERAICAKCGERFPRRFETTEYCFKCTRIENKFDDDDEEESATHET